MNQVKEITIYDIAEELKISPATVSRGLKDHPAISKDTKKRIVDAAKKMGYRSNTFASNLRKKRTNTIGVIVPRLNSSFMSDVIAGFEKIANEAGYNLIISQSLETEKKEIVNTATMYNNRVDGLLVSLAYDTKNFSHFEPFIEKGIPLLFFDRVHSHPKCSSIVIDNQKAAYDITMHLIEQGCKNLMHITGNLSRNVYSDRLNGVIKALTTHGLSLNPENLIINNLSSDAGTKAARNILQMKALPDAIFVTNDACAASCMLELKRNGIKIPQDVLFAGFNNDYISCVVEPNLSTVNYKGFELGEVAAQTMINHLNRTQNLNLTQSIVMKHEVIIRESSLKVKTDAN